MKQPAWTWSPDEGTDQWAYNHARLQFCVTDEWSYVIKHCDRCQSTDILVGQSEVDSRFCDSCLEIDTIRDKTKRDAMTDAWDKIRPSSRDYPKRVEPG